MTCLCHRFTRRILGMWNCKYLHHVVLKNIQILTFFIMEKTLRVSKLWYTITRP